eukprot:7243260-Lingulodinium_polyedra.AAC.1
MRVTKHSVSYDAYSLADHPPSEPSIATLGLDGSNGIPYTGTSPGLAAAPLDCEITLSPQTHRDARNN